MRITEGTIYLVQPVFGRDCLTGAATIGTTWLDYTFPAEDAAPELGQPPAPPAGCRVLIPLSNVTAVVMGPEESNP